MLKKVNQKYNLELPDSKLVKYHETIYYITLQIINKWKKKRITLSNNHRVIERHHFQIHKKRIDFSMLFLAKKKHMLINILEKLV